MLTRYVKIYFSCAASFHVLCCCDKTERKVPQNLCWKEEKMRHTNGKEKKHHNICGIWMAQKENTSEIMAISEALVERNLSNPN